ncbi:hypothetical protein [Rhodothalassium salexigens]|uniref:hypothetical protein n=1 Tax=Rhodothalassium salexigens TaxID=1086 RepID=UPI0019112D86|nr:hypothetical protein [Rhodothalassium salexigens]
MSAPASAAPPPLPEGLGQPPEQAPEPSEPGEPGEQTGREPALPPGLGGTNKPDAEPGRTPPALPAGLGAPGDQTPARGEDQAADAPSPIERVWGGITGFAETRTAVRLADDPRQDAFAMGEARLQLDGTWYTGPATFNLTVDLLGDAIARDRSVDLERGRGFVDLRNANILLRPFDFADVKIGRQILTWGVGDLVFLNDLFPKDFVSFFIGRDTEYLKAPSDAVRVSLFSGLANLDMVYMPRFEPNRFITGERLSLYNPALDALVGGGRAVRPVPRDDWFGDDEWAVRLYRNVGAFEVAAYAFRGYYKNPEGLTPAGGFRFPELAAYGASLRGPVGAGILSAEMAYYHSREDPGGTDFTTPNSQWRALIGYEWEWLPNLTVGAQVNTEINTDVAALRAALPAFIDAESPFADRARHQLTLRMTKQALNQTLTLSLFTFWSPNQKDGHVRLRAGYKITDQWLVEGGANLFFGARDDSFFGQLQDAGNVFFALRRNF